MRSILLAAAVVLGGASASMAQAQEAFQGDAAFTYHYVRTNAAPGECGCFGLNGAGISGSWNVRGGWSAVTEFSSEYTSKATPGNSSLTLTTFLAGARYRLPSSWLHRVQGARRVQPFAQVLLGGGHSRRRRGGSRRCNVCVCRADGWRRGCAGEFAICGTRTDRLLPYSVCERQE